MALHIVGVLDVLVIAIMVLISVDASKEKNSYINYIPSTNDEILYDFYLLEEIFSIIIIVLYLAPRLGMYIFTCLKITDVKRLLWYFRTRIVTFLILLIIFIVIMCFALFNISDLVSAFDSTTAFMLLLFVIPMISWAIMDVYCSV